MASVGKLVVELFASTAKFQADLGKAAASAEANSKRIGAAATFAKNAFATVAGGLGIGSLVLWGREMIRSAEELQDLSEATGSTVESLSRLKNIAAVDGAEFGKFQDAIQRLAAGMAGAEEGSSKTAKALEFLKITATDPAQALEEIAVKLDKFADGAGKAALARDLFAKGGVSFISTLKQIASSSEVVASVTTAQAAEASRLAEAYRSLQVNSERVKNELASGLVPVLANAVEQFVEGKRVAGGFFQALVLFGTINPFRDLPGNIRAVRLELEQLQADKAGDSGFSKFFNGITGKSFDPAIEDAQKKLTFLKFQQRQQALALIDPSNDDARDLRAKFKPALPYLGGADEKARRAGPKDDPTKKLLEGQLKAIEAQTDKVRDSLQYQQEYYQKYFDSNYSSYSEYFEKKKTLQDEELKVTVDGINQQITALETYKTSKGRTQTDIADTDNKIADLQSKREKAEQKAAQTSVLGWFDAKRAADAYAESVKDIQIRLLEAQGKNAAAAALRIQSQNAGLRQTFKNNGDTGALLNLDGYEAAIIAQARLSEQSREFSVILGEVGNAQARIGILRESGAITELDALSRMSEANKARIVDLTRIAEAYEEIARASGDPTALAAADAMRLKIEELASATTLVADKFNAIFIDSFSDAFSSVVTGTKSVKDAFKDLEKSIVQSISRIASQNIAEAIFGKGGATGGGFGDLFAKFFGGASGGSGGGGFDFSKIVQSLFGGLFGGGGAGGFAVGPQFGFAANGSNFTSGGPYVVGERGTEIVVPPRGSKVIPNHMIGGGGGTTINQYITPPRGADTRSSRQIGAMAADQVRTVQRRR